MINSFLLQDIPRHPDTCLFEVREAFKRSLLLGFQAHIRAYIAFFSRGALRGPLRGACAPNTRRRRVALRATDAEPLINTLVPTVVQQYSHTTVETHYCSSVVGSTPNAIHLEKFPNRQFFSRKIVICLRSFYIRNFVLVQSSTVLNNEVLEYSVAGTWYSRPYQRRRLPRLPTLRVSCLGSKTTVSTHLLKIADHLAQAQMKRRA